ncbi:MAG TPA: hypothetical protein VIV11_06930 [Kofleriaceae bacterium]
MRSVGILLVFAAAPAWADSDGAWDFEVNAAADAAHATSAAMTAATTAETTGEAGGGVVLGYQLGGSADECRTLALTQDAYWFRRGGDTGVAFAGATEICIDQIENPDGSPGTVVRFPRITGGYDLRTATRPRFDAPATLHADEYSLYGVHFDWGFFERRNAQRRFTAARIDTRADVTLQGVDATVREPTQNLLSIDFSAFSAELARDTEQPTLIEAGRVAFRHEGNFKTSLVTAVPFSFHGWRRGAFRLAADAGYTYGHAEARRLHVVLGGGGVETEVGDLSLALRVRREVLPAVDPVVIVDDRVTAEARYPVGGGALAAAGFAATSLALSVRDRALDRRDFTGGGSLGYRRPFGRYLLWSTVVEVGRSFYPRFDQATPEVATVARATTRLEARLGLTRSKRIAPSYFTQRTP